MDKVYRILFIGNSYTYYNDMPSSYFARICKEAAYNVEVDTVVRGGWTLEQHADPASETGAEVIARLSGEPYDFVVLQEQSLRPVIDTERFFSAVRVLVERIRRTGAIPILYCTWSRKEGSQKLDEYGLTKESMTRALVDAYGTIASELDVAVSYVGLAFYDVGDDVMLYSPDKSHPSPEGSYLAALCLFYSIFGKSDKVSDGGLDCDVARRLERSAKSAVFGIVEF